MRRLFSLMACFIVCFTIQAQRITREYNNVPLDQALRQLNDEQSNYTINFLFNDLEDFRVTTSIEVKTLPEAIRQMIGFYPIRMTVNREDHEIFVECVQKSNRHLTGIVTDENNEPLALANIAVLNPQDSTLLNGGVSNESGIFVIPIDQKEVIVRITYIGYKPIWQTCTEEDMGTIRLQPEPHTIGNVSVKGTMPQYKMTTGGVTVEVEHSILHDVGTADDLLSMLPLVQGRDGEFTVLAKGEPEIYINNKKVNDTKELKQLKSIDIKNVDVITAPGAQYNAEVNAVIRIKTLKTQGDGFSVQASSETSRNNKWSNYDDLTLKYRTGGLEAFANVAFDYGHYSNDEDIDQELHIKKDVFDVKAFIPVRSSWTELQYKAGLSYDFNADHSVGLSFSSKKNLSNQFKTDMTQHYLKNGAFYGDVNLLTDIEELDKPVWELNTYYVGKAGKLGIDLNATLLRRESENDLDQMEYSVEMGNRPITTISKEKNTMAAGKLVLTYPIWKGMLNVGSEATSTQSHGNNFNKENIIPEADNEMKEKNIAGFAGYEMQLGQWYLNAGLRYEHVAADYSSFGEWQAEPSRTYNDWFPNLSAAWHKDKWGAQLSYSKRITRPPYGLLSSVIVYDSRMFYEGGNPLLRPSVRQSIDFNLTYSWLNFVTGFTREKDFFTHIVKVYDEEKEIGIFQTVNFDHQDRVYVTLVASPKFGFWQPTATLHYYQQMFDAEAYGAPKKLNKPEFSAGLQSWFIMGPTAKALIDIGYSGSNHWGMMYRGSNFMVNVRLQKSFWQERLSCTLYANDIFRTIRTKATTYYDIGKTVQDVYQYTQKVGITLSYNFNVTRSKYRGTGAGNEEKSRLQ
ncbi:MAG: outer membrane beta-barrel protein [Bacteroidales bacterium]|nr:outer membrane beta-barrel protein [Bacteroidales bacterium]